jgi:hypothetical protein
MIKVSLRMLGLTSFATIFAVCRGGVLISALVETQQPPEKKEEPPERKIDTEAYKPMKNFEAEAGIEVRELEIGKIINHDPEGRPYPVRFEETPFSEAIKNRGNRDPQI